MAMKLRRCIGMALVTVVAAGACGGSGSRGTLDKPPTSILENPATTASVRPTTLPTAKPADEGAAAAARRCEAEPGSAIDVAHEPAWRQYAPYRPWTDRNGCLV